MLEITGRPVQFTLIRNRTASATTSRRASFSNQLEVENILCIYYLPSGFCHHNYFTPKVPIQSSISIPIKFYSTGYIPLENLAYIVLHFLEHLGLFYQSQDTDN